MDMLRRKIVEVLDRIGEELGVRIVKNHLEKRGDNVYELILFSQDLMKESVKNERLTNKLIDMLVFEINKEENLSIEVGIGYELDKGCLGVLIYFL